VNATSTVIFADRRDAGRRLANLLTRYSEDPNLLILALPRGGVPVAAEIARHLKKPFDALVVRKLGVPGDEELAMGAIASGGAQVLRHELISQLRLTRSEVDAVIDREKRELSRREKIYRHGRGNPPVAGRTVMVVDDGVATGATMLAAIQLLRRQKAAKIVVAVPVAPRETIYRLREEADDVIAVIKPDLLLGVGRWYEDYSQSTDVEVQGLLDRKWQAKDPNGSHTTDDSTALQRITRQAIPLTGAEEDFDGILQMIGNASVVLLGESSHGTQEFYQVRAQITKRLIEEKGFTAVAVEADWPDAYRVNRYVRGESEDNTAAEALAGFSRFPSWMWRNTEVLNFINWMKEHNQGVNRFAKQVGFYGLDLYSLHKSMGEVIAYLEVKDPEQAIKARNLYACLDRYGPDPQNYGLMAGSGVSDSCRAEVVQQLIDLRAKEVEYLANAGQAAADEYFFAEQNARLVKNAEEYYREMFRSDVSSWNLRDRHMMETLVELISHLLASYGTAKVVVWAHNSHLGDARATEMSQRGELSIGQLVRQAFPYQNALIGFTTYSGTVTAASGWHLPPERKVVQPAMEESYEHLFHQVGKSDFWLDLTEETPAVEALRERRLERAIGVVYHPESERESHYMEACIADQYDAVLHYDVTRAVEPLDPTTEWSRDEAPETFPAGL
jgi:erythromycin esterase-like protein/predicted phosphoribosyltransferase